MGIGRVVSDNRRGGIKKTTSKFRNRITPRGRALLEQGPITRAAIEQSLRDTDMDVGKRTLVAMSMPVAPPNSPACLPSDREVAMHMDVAGGGESLPASLHSPVHEPSPIQGVEAEARMDVVPAVALGQALAFGLRERCAGSPAELVSDSGGEADGEMEVSGDEEFDPDLAAAFAGMSLSGDGPLGETRISCIPQ